MHSVVDGEEESEKKPRKVKLICIKREGDSTDRKVQYQGLKRQRVELRE